MMYDSIIWKRTALLLAAMLAAVTASTSPSHVPVFRADPNTFEISTEMVPGATCDNPGNAFKSKAGVCIDTPLFKDIKKNSTDIIRLMDNTADLGFLLAYLSRFSGPYVESIHHLDMNAVSTFLKGLSEDALQSLPESVKSGFPREIDYPYARLIPLMNRNQTTKLNNSLVADAIKNATTDGIFRRLVNSLHKEVVAENLGLIKEQLLNNRSGVRLWKLGEDVMALLLAEDDFCSAIDPEDMLVLGERKERAKKVSPECFALVDWTDCECDSRIRSFDVKVFSKMENGLSKSCLNLFTEPMVKEYASSMAKEGQYHCPNLDIQYLTMAAAKGLSDACFASPYIEGSQTRIRFGPKWLVVGDTALAALGDDNRAFEKIHKDDWKYITLAQKTEYLKGLEDACGDLPQEFFMYNRGVKLSNKCFDELDPEVKGTAFLSAVLDDDVLASVSSISDWKGLDSDQKTVEGLKILELAEEVKNIEKIISLMSSKEANSDVCSEVTDLKDHPVLQKYCSQKCIDNLPDKLTFSTLAELNPRISLMVSLDQFMEAESSEWSSIKPDHFHALMAGGNLCKRLNEDHLSQLTDDTIEVMDAQCVSELDVLDKLPSNFYKAVKPRALRKLDAEMAGKLTLDSLSDDQFAELGADTGDKHPATQWTKDTISSFSDTRIAKVDESTWSLMPPAAYDGISASRIADIPADKMGKMSDAQVRGIPNEAVQKLSEAQAAKIGESYQGTDKSPVAYLAGVITDAKVKAVLDSRMQPPA
ncbi:hypothetical protein PSACC_01835 [Paramicrosporidium saccamoebae]|uniref:Uncharacterized protein n=1 Tax=Paramicrosporidium saccamoebae TaxID=1246581 RepID=A0A2H9TKS6_9FUNG|nr:hypothetical protein PSACC_01835 [Paramicrosporidium saccamoebae]